MQKRPDNAPVPTTDEPVFELGPTEFEVIWEKYKSAILIGGGALLIGVVGFFSAMAITHAKREAAMEALAAASSPEEYRAVITDHPNSVEAGNAALLLAAAQRDAGETDDSATTLREFLASQPRHPLAPLALVGLAGLAASADDSAAAKAEFDRILSEYPSSFAAPFALFAEGQMALAAGDRRAALEAFQRLSRLHPSSVATGAAQGPLMALESMIAGATPAPAVSADEIQMPDVPEPPESAMDVIDTDADPQVE